MSCNIDFVNDWELRYQGAESRIYFGLHSGNRCVIKHRFSKKYRHPVLDRKLTKERTKRERRMIERVSANSKSLSPYMPRVVWSNEDTILMTEITDCETLYDHIERDSAISSSLALMIGRCVAELHNIGIIHGDLTTSNLVLMPKTKKQGDGFPNKKIKSNDISETHVIVPIDFGLSTGSAHPEERAVDLFVLERALLSTHFPDSEFFNTVFACYLEAIDDAKKIGERFAEVRLRGRKADFM